MMVDNKELNLIRVTSPYDVGGQTVEFRMILDTVEEEVFGIEEDC